MPINLQDAQAAESKLMLNTYARYPVLLTRGEGVHLYDAGNTEYLDLLSGIGVCALGYNHPAITAAINAQAKTLIHTSNLFYHPHTAELALRLTEITGLDRVFLTNSGTEAWEAALKLARARRPAAQRRQACRHQVPRARTQLSRPHHGLRRHHAQVRLPRAFPARDA